MGVKTSLPLTCKFLVMRFFFCSGVRVAGSIEKDSFPFNRISEAATAILIQCAGVTVSSNSLSHTSASS